MNKNIHIILDYGHGKNCPGKCSPDKSFFEWQFNREIGKAICAQLKTLGYNVHETWTQDHEPSSVPDKTCTKAQLNNALYFRANEANRLCAKFGKSNCIFVSIHANAATNGSWSKAGGWCAFTSKGQTKADILAECLYDAAREHLAFYADFMEKGKKAGAYTSAQRPFRTDKTDGDSDLEENFYVLRKTACPAVLTENFFYDNAEDLKLLKSAETTAKIVQLHVDGIVKYIENLK